MNKHGISQIRLVNCVNFILVVILKPNFTFRKSLGNEFPKCSLNFAWDKISQNKMSKELYNVEFQKIKDITVLKLVNCCLQTVLREISLNNHI